MGWFGLLALVGGAGVVARNALVGAFAARDLWLIGVPLGMGVVGSLLHGHSWRLAEYRGFRYDYAKQEASWDEGGARRVFRWRDGRG